LGRQILLMNYYRCACRYAFIRRKRIRPLCGVESYEFSLRLFDVYNKVRCAAWSSNWKLIRVLSKNMYHGLTIVTAFLKNRFLLQVFALCYYFLYFKVCRTESLSLLTFKFVLCSLHPSFPRHLGVSVGMQFALHTAETVIIRHCWCYRLFRTTYVLFVMFYSCTI